MSHFKSFLLGVGVSFGVYYLTKRSPDGRSILDNPKEFAERTKDQAIADIVETVKEKIS